MTGKSPRLILLGLPLTGCSIVHSTPPPVDTSQTAIALAVEQAPRAIETRTAPLHSHSPPAIAYLRIPDLDLAQEWNAGEAANLIRLINDTCGCSGECNGGWLGPPEYGTLQRGTADK
jgi:hypothetical protein